jgi:hypothetical protein
MEEAEVVRQHCGEVLGREQRHHHQLALAGEDVPDQQM